MTGKKAKNVRRQAGGVGWRRTVVHGEVVLRCTVCDAVVPVAKWWEHKHPAPNGVEGVGNERR